jgi:hypothetical protein
MKLLEEFGNTNVLVCVIINQQGVILNGNTLFNAYFKNAIGKNYLYMVAEECYPEIKEICRKAYHYPGKYFLLQVRARIVGHSWAWFSFEVFYSPDDKAYGLIGVKAAQSVSKDDLLLDRYRTRMQEIAFIQSHEIRGPLSRILMLSDFQKSLDDFEEIKRMSVLIWDASSELDSVVKKNIGLTSLES